MVPYTTPRRASPARTAIQSPPPSRSVDPCSTTGVRSRSPAAVATLAIPKEAKTMINTADTATIDLISNTARSIRLA